MPNYKPLTCQNFECDFRKLCREFGDINEKDCVHYIPLKSDSVPVKWEK